MTNNPRSYPRLATDHHYGIAAIWMGLAYAAAMIAGWTGISVSLIKIVVGIATGSAFHLDSNAWIAYLAGQARTTGG